MSDIVIKHPGLMTTIQDLGRTGFQKYGVPVSGPMDAYSLQLANYLTGNSLGASCLEITYTGPEILFNKRLQISFCGADMKPKINGKAVSMYETIEVEVSDVLTFGSNKKGTRCYMGFSGSLDFKPVMGSYSTYLRANLGGIKGRQLKAGDRLKIKKRNKKITKRKIPEDFYSDYPSHSTLRILPGPETNLFSLKGIKNFLTQIYKVMPQSDRMGIKLEGPAIELINGSDILSSAVTFGTIQVPSDGTPIIMGADRQTIGGYARIANVISADLPVLGQLKAGNTVQFKEISLTVAHELFKQQNNKIRSLFLSKK